MKMNAVFTFIICVHFLCFKGQTLHETPHPKYITNSAKPTEVPEYVPDSVTPAGDNSTDSNFILLPVIALVILLSVIVILFIHNYKSEISYYIFSKGICLKLVSEKDVDADKEYDAFVSYNEEDEDWIVDFLLPGLETGVPSYKLCPHNRDWLPSELQMRVSLVESSRRTIIVLTDNYLNNQWNRLEFDIAYQQALQDKVRRVIVVVPNEVPDLSMFENRFRAYITLTTYVEAKKPFFWTKLRASMPRTLSMYHQQRDITLSECFSH